MTQDSDKPVLLLTGATGNIGNVLTPYLLKHYNLILVDLDLSEVDDEVREKSQLIEKDLTDPKNCEGLLDGVDYVVHLAGDPRADAEFYESLFDANFKLTYNLFREAAQATDLKRLIFASSIHAVGGYPLDTQVNTAMFPRPADLYGVSKAYMEVLASYYAFKTGKEFVGIRIGGFEGIEGENETLENLIKYLSPDDMCQLVSRCLEAPLKRPFLLVNGVSDNTFKRLDITQAREDIGYDPKDNAFDIYQVFNETTDNISTDWKKDKN